MGLKGDTHNISTFHRKAKLHWVRGDDDDPFDQCAYGHMLLQIDGAAFVESSSGPWNLTMAGLYLLRTLTADHTPEHSVADANLLIPHCGHAPWLIGEGECPLVCMGCDLGIDLEIVHSAGEVSILSWVAQWVDKEACVRLGEWRHGVLNFVKEIETFYAKSAPKTELDKDLYRCGWAAFWKEWNERKSPVRAT